MRCPGGVRGAGVSGPVLWIAMDCIGAVGRHIEGGDVPDAGVEVHAVASGDEAVHYPGVLPSFADGLVKPIYATACG